MASQSSPQANLLLFATLFSQARVNGVGKPEPIMDSSADVSGMISKGPGNDDDTSSEEDYF